MLRCKIFTGKNGAHIENQFNEWCDIDDIASAQITEDRNRNVVLAVFYDAPEAIEMVAEEVLETALEVSEPLPEVLCPHCLKLTRPGEVPRGPNKGKLKCTVCGRVFEKDQAEGGDA